MSDPAVDVPHFSLPLSLGVGGTFACVEQDSEDDVIQGAYVLLSTPLGGQIELPTYGYDDQTFAPVGGIDVASAKAAIAEWQPRAKIEVEVSVDSIDELMEYVNIGVDVETGEDDDA